ncbi:MAG: fibrillarin-like rRNA/tRNA 2'-O-methyltransferase, partial [Candidatus Bathyarchaeia archaeon]
MQGIGARPHERFEGVYLVRLEDGSERLATKNLSPGISVYGERLIRVGPAEYRLWDPFRSTLAAA